MKKIKAYLLGDKIVTNDSLAQTLYQKSCFGEPISEKIRYSLSEAMFLVEKKVLEIWSPKRKLTSEELFKKFKRIDKKFPTKYAVFKDLRKKGYIVKTALKFGADFRVYEKGKKPKQTHSKWIVFTDTEQGKIDWKNFAAKNRIAHSTRKKLLIAIVDEEEAVTYYEVDWIKP